MPSLHIHQPCTADWNEMTATEKGAFCKLCSKEVIDFTQMSNEDIVAYFKVRNNQPLCGRFNSDQLNKPLLDISPAVFRMGIPFWQKFLAAVFLYFASFLTGCSSSVTNLDRVQDEPVVMVQPPVLPKQEVPVIEPEDTISEIKPTTKPKKIRINDSLFFVMPEISFDASTTFKDGGTLLGFTVMNDNTIATPPYKPAIAQLFSQK